MVGVPGRSKGCHTCRRRKKGCDLQRPVCGQCQKARIQCFGYERQWIFVNVTTPPLEAQEVTTARKSSPSVPLLRDSLAHTALEEKYLGLFWELYLPKGQDSVKTLPKYSLGNWIPAILDLYKTDPALHKSLLALCMGTIGRRQDRRQLTEDSLKFYFGAVSDMNVGLKHPTRGKSDALLLATRTLGLYELICGLHDSDGCSMSWATSWQGHNLGQMGLILQRTPEMHLEGHAHNLFVDARMNVTMALILLRKRSPMNDSRWKTIPWSKRPKTPTDVLYDIFVAVPGLLEDADIANTCCDCPQKSNLLQRLIDDCWAVDNDLCWWLESLAPRAELEDLMRKGFGAAKAADYAIAHVMCKYWSACIITYNILRQALAAYNPTAIVPLPDRADPRPYCKSIVDIAELFFAPEAGVFGKHTLMFPLGTAFAYLLSTEDPTAPSPEMEKMREYFARPSCGLRVMNFMHSMLRSGPALQEEIDNDTDMFKARARAWLGMVVPHTPPMTPESDETSHTTDYDEGLLPHMIQWDTQCWMKNETV